MIQINKVELQGYIGNVRENKINNSYAYDFSVATNMFFGDVMETTWHTIKMWSNTQRTDLEKGKAVHVNGYLRSSSYIDNNGNDRKLYYIQAKSENVKIVTNE